jgi:hypothetical protein
MTVRLSAPRFKLLRGGPSPFKPVLTDVSPPPLFQQSGTAENSIIHVQPRTIKSIRLLPIEKASNTHPPARNPSDMPRNTLVLSRGINSMHITLVSNRIPNHNTTRFLGSSRTMVTGSSSNSSSLPSGCSWLDFVSPYRCVS